MHMRNEPVGRAAAGVTTAAEGEPEAALRGGGACRGEGLALHAPLLLLPLLVAWHAWQRTGFNIKTETDYVAAFHMEASRFLAGEALWVRFHPPGYPASRVAVTATCAVVLAALAVRLSAEGYALSETRAYYPELHAAVEAVREHTQPGDVVCARKPLLAYYTQRVERSIPAAAGLAALAPELAALREREGGADVYVLYGELERDTRAELIDLATPDAVRVPWLTVVAHGDAQTPSVLYRFEPNQLADSGDSAATP